jgi:hypothetical protein
MKDAIIAEVWRNRDMLAKRYGHNLDDIVAAMKKRQRHPLTPLAKIERTENACSAHASRDR